MGKTEGLELIRSDWLSNISKQLTQVEGIRESFLGQLSQFYDLLIEAVDQNNPSRLDDLLDEWIQARTETDINVAESSLSPILGQIFRLTIDTAQDHLGDNVALELISNLGQVYTYAVETVASKEAQVYIQRITAELDQTRLTLERLEKSKSDFISVAAHELKTPLTLIEGYASMLSELIPTSEPGGHAAICLNGIRGGTNRLREIVDDMIDVSLIDNNLLSLNFQPVWINRLLSQVQRDLTAIIEERKLSFTISDFPGSNEMIFGDGERLFQAFRNVISNAIKYTPDGGKIDIGGRMLPGFIETIITDTGIGIDTEDQSRIFTKFGRLGSVTLHSSGKTKFKGGGPGLGLLITKGIIESHRGAIWVESEGFDEKRCPGSTFHILLPMRKAPPDDQVAKLFRPLMES